MHSAKLIYIIYISIQNIRPAVKIYLYSVLCDYKLKTVSGAASNADLPYQNSRNKGWREHEPDSKTLRK